MENLPLTSKVTHMDMDGIDTTTELVTGAFSMTEWPSTTSNTPWYKKLINFLFKSWTFGKFLESTQAVEDDAVVGKIGLVLAEISPTKVGEVSIPVRGGTEIFLAVSNRDYMPVNTSVYVKQMRTNRTIIVEPYYEVTTPVVQ